MRTQVSRPRRILHVPPEAPSCAASPRPLAAASRPAHMSPRLRRALVLGQAWRLPRHPNGTFLLARTRGVPSLWLLSGPSCPDGPLAAPRPAARARPALPLRRSARGSRPSSTSSGGPPAGPSSGTPDPGAVPSPRSPASGPCPASTAARCSARQAGATTSMAPRSLPPPSDASSQDWPATADGSRTATAPPPRATPASTRSPPWPAASVSPPTIPSSCVPGPGDRDARPAPPVPAPASAAPDSAHARLDALDRLSVRRGIPPDHPFFVARAGP